MFESRTQLHRAAIHRLPVAVIAAGFAACVALAASGCQPNGQPRPSEPGLNAGNAWRPSPAELRIFPTTRFVIEHGRPVLETRIEVLDSMGDPLKTSGQFRFELFAAPTDAGRATRRLYEWNQTLSTRSDQLDHFDAVTFAYRFQLQLDDRQLENRPTILRVTLTPATGPRLTASYAVRTDW